jgi:hypothetical protein
MKLATLNAIFRNVEIPPLPFATPEGSETPIVPPKFAIPNDFARTVIIPTKTNMINNASTEFNIPALYTF